VSDGTAARSGGTGGVRLARVLGPEHVGRRVVVRRTLPDGSAGDLLGELVAWGGGRLTVRTRDGREVVVEESAMLAGKPVPPPPVRRPRAARDGQDARDAAPAAPEVADLALERAAALGWPALESERLGDWLLRAGGGFTGRANSVLPLGDPGLPLEDALAAVRAWYAARGLPPRVQVPLPAQGGLDADLVARGWAPSDPTGVLVAALGDVLRRVEVRPGAAPVAVADDLDEAWLAAYHYRGAALPGVARDVLRGRPVGGALGFLRVEDPAGGGLLGVARVAVAEGWAGLTAVEVAPRARRRGLGAALLRAAARWASERGAHGAYVQVAQGNEAALALYERAGFRRHHAYRYLTRAP
jgi:ribosomal protein S18 acetylase RimI-like enzyme